MKLTGAEMLIECLREQEVEVIFGYPGGAVLPIYDVLHGVEDIKHVLTAHEQGASHAADGYARVTGKVGVCLTTSGPGATNTITGIATAYMDSVPMVVITGQVAKPLMGRDSFQEVDITGITHPITKYNYIVKDVNRLPHIIRQAFSIAKAGRPGPVLIDIPKDVQTALGDYSPASEKDYIVPNSELAELKEDDILMAIDAINNSKKPVIYAGGGINISKAHDKLLEFSEKIKGPVSCSLMATGAFPSDHPNFMGMVGMHGSRYSNYAFTNCDLLIALGARFSDRVVSDVSKFAPDAKIIHVDIDPAELGKNVETHIAICGDVGEVLDKFNEALLDREEGEWNRQVDSWKRDFPLKYDTNGSLSPKYILERLSELTEGEAIISTEVGQNQMWAAQFYKFSIPGSFVSSGGLGTMGYGLGASIGAAIGRPDRKVVNVAGDGSFKMNSTELATISRYQIPLIQLLLNNNSLGMVRQWQDLFFDQRYSHTSLGEGVDFMKLAEAYSIKAYRLEKNEDVEDVLKEALSLNEPVFIECLIDPDDKVYPIVPPGAAIDELLD